MEGDVMGYTAHILRNADGKVVSQYFDCEFSKYWWQGGNAACDCNRAIFFGDDNHECGHDRFYILKIVSGDGVILYTEKAGSHAG